MLFMSDRFRRRILWRRNSENWKRINQHFRWSEKREKEEKFTQGRIDQAKAIWIYERNEINNILNTIT
jgi:hypothetical protein